MQVNIVFDHALKSDPTVDQDTLELVTITCSKHELLVLIEAVEFADGKLEDGETDELTIIAGDLKAGLASYQELMGQ